MYRFSDNQISFTDFNTPVGMKLNPENRWVKKAKLIPWDEIEIRYAQLFVNRKGNAAKPLRLALGACMIQAEYGFSDEETALQIQEGAYLQFFCGYTEYNDEKLPFDPSTMVYFRKRLTPEIFGEITKKIIDELYNPQNGKKPRIYRRNAIVSQLQYIKRNLNFIEAMDKSNLSKFYKTRLETVKDLYKQQKFMYDNKTHSVKDRIVSISQPWLRPIVRGKAKADVEFGDQRV